MRRPAGVVLAALCLAFLGTGAAPAAPAPDVVTPDVATSASLASTAALLQAAPPVAPDDPLATNPPSPLIDQVPASSAEVTAAVADRRNAEDRLADTKRRRDDLQRRIVELGDDRRTAVTELADRRTEEAARLRDRTRAAAVVRIRTQSEGRALTNLRRAQEEVRDLLVASYISNGTVDPEWAVILARPDTQNDAVSRLALGDAALQGRLSAAARKARIHTSAVRARKAAARRLDVAAGALGAARDATRRAERRIVDIDSETTDTIQAERDAGTEQTRREGELLVAVGRIPAARVRAPVDGQDFPLVALDAWVKAAERAPCQIPWWLLAGISRIEGRHGQAGGGFDGRGRTRRPIRGPRLDGAGFARIGDTDGGALDGDPVFDRAVGPMQFIPSTWARWGRDGDGDMLVDPDVVFDAAAAAAAYLCFGRTNLLDGAQMRAALFSYNPSDAYVTIVIDAARSYQASLSLPGVPGGPAG